MPFSLCSYAFPKFKDSDKYFAVCGSFESSKLVSTSNQRMGPHDDCNDIHLKFETPHTCSNNQSIMRESLGDIRCDCPIIEDENAFETNCQIDRQSREKLMRIIKISVIIIVVLILIIGMILLVK